MRRVRAGEVPAVVLLVGVESALLARATEAVRQAVLGAEGSSYNEDRFVFPDAEVMAMVMAARTQSLLGGGRLVWGQQVHKAPAQCDWQPLFAYAQAPTPGSCVLLQADKLDARTKLAKQAKAAGWWVSVDRLRGAALQRLLAHELKARDIQVDRDALIFLLDHVGDALDEALDAVERLSLYLGPGGKLDAAAVQANLPPKYSETIWQLVDALTEGDAAATLRAAVVLLQAREPPLRILAMVARQLRIVTHMRTALRQGASPQEACRSAGAPPFKAHALAQACRWWREADLSAAFIMLADCDVALKSSRLSDDMLLERTLLQLCARTNSTSGAPQPRTAR